MCFYNNNVEGIFRMPSFFSLNCAVLYVFCIYYIDGNFKNYAYEKNILICFFMFSNFVCRV